MKRFSLLILSLCVGILSVAAQRMMGGKVVNVQGDPLSYGNVICRSIADSSMVAYSITSDEGIFRIEVKPACWVQISFIGYKTWTCLTDTLTRENLGRIKMQDDDNFLNEVDVVGKLTTTTPNKTVVALGNSDIVQGRNGLEILSILPNIRYDYRGGLKINGKEGCKVMLNGRILEMEDQELYRYLSQLRAETIQSVTIEKHAGAQYDSSVNGVIHIKTQKNEDSSWNMMAGLDNRMGKDGYLGLQPDLFFSSQNKGLNLYGGLSFSNIDLNNTDTESTQYLLSGYENMQTEALLEKRQQNNLFSGRLGTLYEWNQVHSIGLEIDGSYTDKKRREDTYTDITDPSGLYGDTHSVYCMPDSIKNINTSFFYQFMSADESSYLKVSSDVYWHETNNQESTDIYDGSENKIDSLSVKGAQHSDRLTWVAKIDGRKVLTNGALNVGLKYISTDMNNDIQYQQYNQGLWEDDVENSHLRNYRERVAATYAEYSLSLDDWSIDAGLRYEQTWETTLASSENTSSERDAKSSYGNLLPSFIVTYKMNKELRHTLSLDFRSGVHRPTFADLSPYRTKINQFTVVAGNPDLSPTYSYSSTVGLTLFDTYYVGLSAMIEKNRIDWTAYPYTEDRLSVLYRTINIPQVETFQLIGTLPLKPYSWWSLNLDFSGGYKRNQYEIGSEAIWQYYGRCHNLFSFEQLFNVELNASYLSKDIIGNEIMNPHYLVDISLKRAFCDNKLQLTLYGNNIFQKGLDVDIVTADFKKNLVMKDSRFCQNYGLSLRYILNGKAKIRTVDTGNQAERLR